MKRIILMFANMNFTAFASEKFNEQYYREAIMLLEALEIKDGIAKGTLTTESISRIDFLKTVIKAISNKLNLTDVSSDFRYTDVDNDSWAVSYAVSCGLIVDGYKFYPDDDADLEFAKSVITSAAGYEFKDGKYNKAVIETGLISKLRPESAKAFSAGDAYVLIYNLLCAERFERYGDTYELRGNTILSDVYKIEFIKGRMVEDFESSLYGNYTSPYTVMIENSDKAINLYYNGETSELLGRNVKAYYKEDEAILIMPLYEDDILLDIKAKEYAGYDSGKRKLYYNVFEASNRWESSFKVKSEYLPQNMDIIHNDRFTQEHKEVYSILKNADGYNVDSLTLIDTDRNGKSDLMRINTYKTAFVSQPNQNNLTIKDILSKKIIDFDGDDKKTEVVVFNSNGEEIAFGKIPENSVISIFENTDTPEKTKIIVSTSVVSGMVNELSDDKIMIAGEEYLVSENFEAYKNEVKAGATYTFYLDHNYKISGYKLDADILQNLGGVVKIGVSDEDESILIFTIYTIDGNTVKYETANKWKINGSSVYMSSNNKHMYKKEDGSEAGVIENLRVEFIQYRIDSSGKIREIKTAKKDAKTEELGYSAGMNNPEEVFKNPEDYTLVYKHNGKFFMPAMGSESSFNFIGVGTNTKIIKMPSANIISEREKYFDVGVTLKNDDDFPVLGYTLNGSESIVADVIVIVNDSASDPSNSSYYIVKDKCTALNNDGEVGYKLTLYNNSGVETTITTEEYRFPKYDTSLGLTAENLTVDKGDIIKYGVNSKGDASAFIMVYDASEGALATQNPNNWYTSTRVVSGSVYSTEGNHFTYITQKEITGPVDGKLQLGYATSVILVDPDADKKDYIKSGKVSDMTSYLENSFDYANVVYISGYGETRLVVAYLK